MKYQNLDALPELIHEKLVTKRQHPTLPLFIYNYTDLSQYIRPSNWSEPLKDCRGLILDINGELVGRPLRKFWNYELVVDRIPTGELFRLWEKCDGSLGIVCNYANQRVVATRGSFDSDQAIWASRWIDDNYPTYLPEYGLTHLFEIIYPENRKVVDYRGWTGLKLLTVLDHDARDRWDVFEALPFDKARLYYGITDFSLIDSDPQFAGTEGFVVEYSNGFRCKVKLAEYKRLDRLFTEVNTRTIWKLLRTGTDMSVLLDQVPPDFSYWAAEQIKQLTQAHAALVEWALTTMKVAPAWKSRKEFADYARAHVHPQLLFASLDGKDVSDIAWKLLEPGWCPPFRKSEQDYQ